MADIQVLQSPTTSALRSGALSPRQGSVCSETDVPYVSYTAHKPIGESPKKTGTKAKTGGRFSSPRLPRSLKSRGTLVTVNKGSTEKVEDLELVRLAEIPSFLPVMQGEHSQDILARLNPEPLSRMLQRYEDHLRTCATLVAAKDTQKYNGITMANFLSDDTTTSCAFKSNLFQPTGTGTEFR